MKGSKNALWGLITWVMCILVMLIISPPGHARDENQQQVQSFQEGAFVMGIVCDVVPVKTDIFRKSEMSLRLDPYTLVYRLNLTSQDFTLKNSQEVPLKGKGGV